MSAREKIAVIGGGISGIISTYILSQKHDITLFESSSRLGGHAHPVKVNDNLFVDTGFLIFNSHSYKNFLDFLSSLGLSKTVCNTDMSIGIHDTKHKLTYAVNAGWKELFHQKKNLLRPQFLKLLLEIKRFRTIAGASYEQTSTAGLTLNEYLNKQKFSRLFKESFAYPLGASVWSLPSGAMADFPAHLFFQFFSNHKILKSAHGAAWQTMLGSSIQYIEKFEKLTTAKIIKNCTINGIERTETSVIIQSKDGKAEKFDRVVIATHADVALSLLNDPTESERKNLGVWQYQNCKATLHTDTTIFPRINNSWPSWNIQRSAVGEPDDFAITYYLNRIQAFKDKKNYFATLGEEPIDKKTIIEEFTYRHPIFTVASLASQAFLPELSRERTFFCGSYFGRGFHEDAVKSALAVAEKFNLRLSDVKKVL